MFDTYQEIFKARGDSYNKAMQKYPKARVEEFQYLFDSVNIKPNDIVCDIPSGGSYLSDYLHVPTKIFAVDSCPEFIANPNTRNAKHNTNLLISELTNTAMKSQSFDQVLSLAGLHHMEKKSLFFNEVQRLLKPGGQFCIADVAKGSKIDFFLDNIVDKYNSQGHRGDYFDQQTVEQIKASGLTVTEAETKNIYWRFDSSAHAAKFCILLFGLDEVDEAQFERELSTVLGVTTFDRGVGLHWELLYISGNLHSS